MISALRVIRGHWMRIAGLSGLLAVALVLIPPSAASAEQELDRHCVCTNGSGGCPSGFFFCCDFTSSGYTCGCVFLGMGGSCTN